MGIENNIQFKGDVAKKFLGDFSGYLHTDGYAGYNKLTKVKHCNYWAHLRRKFQEAIVVDSEDSIAKTGIDFCDKLFSIEAELDRLTSEERYNKRLTQEKEVFEAFWSWAEKIYPTVLSKTQLGKVFEYAFKRREYLGNYFENGSCAIPNNIAENAISHSQLEEKTGCSVIRLKALKLVLISTVSWRLPRQTALMFFSILRCFSLYCQAWRS